MKGLLLVTVLCVSSSYARNVEFDAQGRVPDTVQWWITDGEAWRIRTFGVDHDLHLYRAPDVSKESAEATTRRNFGDITCGEAEVNIEDAQERPAVALVLKAADLAPHFDVTDRFIFWKPDGAEYRTQTRPKD